MRRSRLSQERPAPDVGLSLAQLGALRAFEEALRAARARMDEHVAAWIRAVNAAREAVPRDVGERGEARLSEGGGPLERFREGMRRARAELEEGVLGLETLRPRDRITLEREVLEHENAEKQLAAANAALRRKLADRERLEEGRRVAASGLDDVQARFESAFTSAPIGMALVDMDGRWLLVNDALCRITGHARGALLTTTLHAITHPQDVDRDADSMRELLDGKVPSFQTEKRFRHARGHYLWVLLTVSLVRDARGQPLYVVKQVQDISERKDLAARQEYLIDHDFLTGLFNRRRFQRELAQEAERVSRYGANGALLMIDLDSFKDVNDAFGHKAGDDLLQEVARALKQRIRRTDIVARVGGDEFAMLLPETNAGQARTVADGIVKTLGQQVEVLGAQAIRVTASVGVALFDGFRPAEVMELADHALYDAKRAGRNRVVMHRQGGGRRERVSARLRETERIRTALEEERLVVRRRRILDLQGDEARS